MILIILIALFLCVLRVIGEVVYERRFPRRTIPLLILFVGIALFALVNL